MDDREVLLMAKIGKHDFVCKFYENSGTRLHPRRPRLLVAFYGDGNAWGASNGWVTVTQARRMANLLNRAADRLEGAQRKNESTP